MIALALNNRNKVVLAEKSRCLYYARSRQNFSMSTLNVRAGEPVDE
jgi:hypothetical protein